MVVELDKVIGLDMLHQLVLLGHTEAVLDILEQLVRIEAVLDMLRLMEQGLQVCIFGSSGQGLGHGC